MKYIMLLVLLLWSPLGAAAPEPRLRDWSDNSRQVVMYATSWCLYCQ